MALAPRSAHCRAARRAASLQRRAVLLQQLLLLLLGAPCLSAAPATGRKQLGATVMVNGFGDLEGAAPGSQLPSCQATLQGARRVSDAVSFALAVFPMAVSKYDKIESWTFKDASGRHVPATADALARWRRGLQGCFAFAVAQGFRVLHVLGHVDPVHPVLLRPATWRNLLLFAPREKAGGGGGGGGGGLSYEDVMLKPVLAALGAAAKPSTAVWFSISGEMGLSNFVAADQWRALLSEARAVLRKQGWQDVRVATALNWQMVCGCVAAADPTPGSFDPLAYNKSFAAEAKKIEQYTQPLAGAFKALLDANDYIGLSAYGSGYPLQGLTWAAVEAPLQTLAHELSFLGISLRDYIRTKPVIYVEQGLGGVLKYQMLPAPDLATVSRYPASGNWPEGGYARAVDPWQRADFAAFRRALYKATLELMAKAAGQQYRLDGVFVWSVGSMDVFGVHPLSTTAAGSFEDPQITAMVTRANGVG
ncbi:MAG: hypothetical protein J3K34DRAFT_34565 [Monoraphidium minutum]|nr:MAG: hypothetical protein J3K34DRAFT_34565 [Monoraphidium minutum]